jgi:hypothetical protein
MVIASLAGFMISSQFVTLEGLEMPYYVVLIGACTLKIAPQYDLAHAPYAFNQLPLPLGEGQGEGAAPWDLALAPSPLGRGSG